ncbi:hypothetical protein [Streptomyces sp. NPDC001165]|uniref:hypothetical protein n=1 Tax=Streptomyces sp. NPDC001165 TaxID=3364546 RepID=UPI0036B68A18
MSTAAATSRTRRLAQRPSDQRPNSSRTFRRRAAAVAAALSLSVAAGIAAISVPPTSATSRATPGDPAWDSTGQAVLADPAWDSSVEAPQ